MNRSKEKDLMRTVLISGGTGLVGSEITKQLTAKGHQVHILTRSPKVNNNELIKEFHWDINKATIDEACLENVTDLIHLAGATIAQKWTTKNKQEIIDSRVKSANLLLETLEKQDISLDSYIGASASGIYKPNTGLVLDEQAEYGDNFLTKVCVAWEKAHQQFSSFAKNVVINRIGIVLAKNGGALEKMSAPINFGFSPYFGNGEQNYSCIHLHDVAKQFVYTLENQLDGIFNCSTEVVSQKELNNAIAQAKGKKTISLPTPTFALKIALGEMSILLTDSIHMSNQKIYSMGFQPKFSTVESALNDIFSGN